MNTIVYKLNGTPLGFIRENKLYDFYGKALGWKTDDFIYNKNGRFAGRVYQIAENHFIIKFLLDLAPLSLPKQTIPDLLPQELNVAIPPNIDKIELQK